MLKVQRCKIWVNLSRNKITGNSARKWKCYKLILRAHNNTQRVNIAVSFFWAIVQVRLFITIWSKSRASWASAQGGNSPISTFFIHKYEMMSPLTSGPYFNMAKLVNSISGIISVTSHFSHLFFLIEPNSFANSIGTITSSIGAAGVVSLAGSKEAKKVAKIRVS